MTIKIRNRFDGSTIHDVDAESLSEADFYRADLSGADLSGADLSWANLSGANLYRANLSGANLSGANLSQANLYRADLSRASLSQANLYRANLSGADLSGAKIGDYEIASWLAQIRRSDSHDFLAFRLAAGGALIRAGCRTMTLPKYRQHVVTGYPDTDKARETLAILDFIEGRL